MGVQQMTRTFKLFRSGAAPIRFLLAALLVVAAGAQTAVAEPVLVNGMTCESYGLLAGQYLDAGTVMVCPDGTVMFEANEGWLLGETHLQVASSPEGIPQKNGNPIPGQFEYKDEHDPPVSFFAYSLPAFSGTSYIAAHAVVLKVEEACVGFDGYGETDRVGLVSTDLGYISFGMVESAQLASLAVGDTATFVPGAYPNDLPIVASPDTSPPYRNIVAFTYNDKAGGNPYRDDYIVDDNGTNAGGNTLTDPQDTSQTELLWHAYAQGLAISADFSGIPGLVSVSLAGVDLDYGEDWQFQFFDASNVLLEQVSLSGDDQSGDGKAFPVNSTAANVAKLAVWGGDNLGIADRIGFAIDNVCVSAAVDDETAWGEGTAFDGANWATYITYTVPDS
jgi:hypothetical protein